MSYGTKISVSRDKVVRNQADFVNRDAGDCYVGISRQCYADVGA